MESIAARVSEIQVEKNDFYIFFIFQEYIDFHGPFC
jgi:hypothetical protein